MAEIINKKNTVILQGTEMPIAVAAFLQKRINERAKNGIYPIISYEYSKKTSDNSDDQDKVSDND